MKALKPDNYALDASKTFKPSKWFFIQRDRALSSTTKILDVSQSADEDFAGITDDLIEKIKTIAGNDAVPVSTAFTGTCKSRFPVTRQILHAGIDEADTGLG